MNHFVKNVWTRSAFISALCLSDIFSFNASEIGFPIPLLLVGVGTLYNGGPGNGSASMLEIVCISCFLYSRVS